MQRQEEAHPRAPSSYPTPPQRGHLARHKVAKAKQVLPFTPPTTASDSLPLAHLLHGRSSGRDWRLWQKWGGRGEWGTCGTSCWQARLDPPPVCQVIRAEQFLPVNYTERVKHHIGEKT